MKKQLLLFTILLASCDRIEIPEDIAEFLYTPTIEKAMQNALQISVSNQNAVYNEKGEELGESSYTLEVDRRELSTYTYRKVENYSGELIEQSSNSNLYLTYKVTDLKFDSDTGYYSCEIRDEGYSSLENQSAVEDYTVKFNYTQSQLQELDNSIFYTQNLEGYLSGGLYMIDFFKRNLAEMENFSVNGDIFEYKISNREYKLNKEIAVVDETLTMNRDGLLVSMVQTAKNKNTGKENSSSMNVMYN